MQFKLNTMKKIYTRCSTYLFIGLLGPNTLFSCSNTRKSLHINPTTAFQCLNPMQIRNVKRSWNNNSGKFICAKIVIPTLATTWVIVGWAYWLLSEADQAVAPQDAAANGTELTTNTINTTISLPMVTAATAIVPGVVTLAGLMKTRLFNGLQNNGSSNRSDLEDIIPTDAPLGISVPVKLLDLSQVNDDDSSMAPSDTSLDKIEEENSTESTSNSSIPTTSLPLYPSPSFTKMVKLIEKDRFKSIDLKYEIDKGFSIDEQDPKDGATLAVRVTQSVPFNFRNIEALYRYKANLNIPNNKGETPLMILIRRPDKGSNHQGDVLSLIKHGADPHQLDHEKRTALDDVQNIHMKKLMEELFNQRSSGKTSSS